MAIPTKEPTLLTDEADEALVPAAPVAMFERLARDPSVDVEKLERLIAMQERIMAHNAEAEFNAAFAAMLPKIPTIVERARTDKTAYAPLEDIIETIRPILAEFGFSLSFRTEWPEKNMVKVVGILTHRAGHSRNSEFLSAADQTGSKNAIQALGSAVHYGRRYTARDLLCIVTREADDDGERSDKGKAPAAPAGYDDWMADMASAADEGLQKLQIAWNQSKTEYRTYTAQYNKAQWASLKTKAGKVRHA